MAWARRRAIPLVCASCRGGGATGAPARGGPRFVCGRAVNDLTRKRDRRVAAIGHVRRRWLRGLSLCGLDARTQRESELSAESVSADAAACTACDPKLLAEWACRKAYPHCSVTGCLVACLPTGGARFTAYSHPTVTGCLAACCRLTFACLSKHRCVRRFVRLAEVQESREG